MTPREPKHAGPFDEHDERLWRDRVPVNAACDRCCTVGKGRYRKREASDHA